MAKQIMIQGISIKLLIVALILLLLPCFAFGAPPKSASPALKAKVPLLKKKVVKKTIAPKNIRKKKSLQPAMKITSITFKTNANGDWTFFYDFKNTGSVTFAPHQLYYKSTQILTNGKRVLIRTVTHNISYAPGAGSTSHSPWDRCSNASKVMVEIIYKGKVLDTKTVNVPPVKVRIGAYSHKKGNKYMFLDLVNSTQYTSKVIVKSIYSGPWARASYNRSRVVVVPANNGTKTIKEPFREGVNLKMEVLFKDEKRCNGKGYVVLHTVTPWWNTTVPDSGNDDKNDLPSASLVPKNKTALLKLKKDERTIAPKYVNRKQNLDDKVESYVAMEITSLAVRTGATGDWNLNLYYKNIGSTTFESNQLKVKVIQILKNGLSVPGLTKSIYRRVPPGYSNSGSYIAWHRNSNASKVMVEIWYENWRLATKTIDVPPFYIAIQRPDCDQGALKNYTDYNVKVDYRVIPKNIPGGVVHAALPDTTILIPAKSTKFLPKVNDLPDGFDLQVLFKDEGNSSEAGFVVLASRFFTCVSDPSLLMQKAPVLITE